jgi:hypothetical protein
MAHVVFATIGDMFVLALKNQDRFPTIRPADCAATDPPLEYPQVSLLFLIPAGIIHHLHTGRNRTDCSGPQPVDESGRLPVRLSQGEMDRNGISGMRSA